jgi:hexosaminidase
LKKAKSLRGFIFLSATRAASAGGYSSRYNYTAFFGFLQRLAMRALFNDGSYEINSKNALYRKCGKNMDTLAVIPKPRVFRSLEGEFRSGRPPQIAGDEFFRSEMNIFTEQFAGCFEKPWQAHALTSAGPCALSAACGGHSPGRIRCVRDESPDEEAYTLTIRPELITLAASNKAGMYNGLQTLRQLFLTALSVPSGDIRIPCADIEDSPRFFWRGYMLDCSRHFFTVPFIKKLIDALSLHHINRFHWHLTDDQGWRFWVKGFPRLTEIGSKRRDRRFPDCYYGGFYSEEEILGIVAFASERHVKIIPEVDLPGHASAILASYPELGCTGGPYQVEDRFGIFDDILCAGNDRVFDLAAAVFDTLAGLFPSKWVHMGGDEVPVKRWEACPKCKARLRETGLSGSRELQSWITVKLAEKLAARGKTAIGWDEVLEDTARFPLPQEVIVMSWRGMSGGLEAIRKNHAVIMSPNTEGCYLDYQHSADKEEPGQLGISSLARLYGLELYSAAMSGEEKKCILGGQANLWTELIPRGRLAEYMTFPRICALAESLWTPAGQKDFEDFKLRLAVHRERLDELDLLQYRGG